MKGVVSLVVISLLAFWLPVGSLLAQEAQGLSPGLLSLDSSVGVVDKTIEDGKSSIEKALGLSIGGFFDTSYTWSSNRPNSPDNISGRYFDKDHNKIVFNDFHLVLDKPEKDWGVGLHLSGDFGRTGELLREATFWGHMLHKEPSAELREAFMTTTVPVGAGLGVKAGLFVTLLGTEILPNPGAYNDNISRSFAFNFGVPLRHLGLLFSYPVLPILTATAGPVSGWDNPHDTNDQPSFLGGLNFTPGGIFSLASNVVIGPEQIDNNGNKRFTWSSVATVKPMDPLTLFLEYTYGHEEAVTPSGRDGTWHGWAGIASYNWTDRFNTALRGEIFKDSDGVRTGLMRDVRLTEFTVTGAYKFTAKLLGRMEFRQDFASKSFFKKGTTGMDKSQSTVALQAIYGF